MKVLRHLIRTTKFQVRTYLSEMIHGKYKDRIDDMINNIDNVPVEL